MYDKDKPALDNVEALTQLGSNKTEYTYEEPKVEHLETFPAIVEDDFFIDMEFPEFTSLCPKTGQPDFGHIRIQYIPAEKCLESKSIKLYFFAFRNFGAFMESMTNKILRDMVEACEPKFMRVTGNFAPRGALAIKVIAEYDELEGYVVNVGRTLT